MDDIDKKILNFLQEDDKASYSFMSEQLGISLSTVHFRVKKLVQSGIIKGFHAKVDGAKVGYPVTAWLGLSVDPRKMESVGQELAQLPEVQLVATCTGTHDMVVQIVAGSAEDVWRFLNEYIKTHDGIGKDFDVSTFLDVYKNTNTTPLK